MQVACFIFIKRRWAEDKEHMENMLDYFCDIREPLQLLLFPEGTDLTGETFNICSKGTFPFFSCHGGELASPRPDLIHSC